MRKPSSTIVGIGYDIDGNEVSTYVDNTNIVADSCA